MNLVFASHSVPTHRDRTNWTKRQKRRLYRVFLGVVVDAANIDPERDFALKIEFQRRIKFHLLMIDTACCRCRYFVCCCWWAIVCFIKTSFIDTWEVRNLFLSFLAIGQFSSSLLHPPPWHTFWPSEAELPAQLIIWEDQFPRLHCFKEEGKLVNSWNLVG